MAARGRAIPSRGRPVPKQPEALRAGSCVTDGRPWLWSSPDPAEREAATSICLACPALQPCRSWALSMRERDDAPALVLGGLDSAQRSAVRRQRAAGLAYDRR
jgi:hypothetical protein